MKILFTTAKGERGGFDYFLRVYDKLLDGYKKTTLCVGKLMYRVIEINSLEDLINIQKRLNQDLIIMDKSYIDSPDFDVEIVIYDGYIE